MPDQPEPERWTITYPFPLKSGQMARLELPTRLERDDAERLIALIRSLVIQGKETR